MQELLDKIDAESKDADGSHDSYGMFVLVLMTHGRENDCIYGTDGKFVRLCDVYALLTPQNFPSLKGKPKLVIVQACGGSKTL